MRVYLLNPPFVKNYIRSSRCSWIPISGSSWYPIFLGYATGWLQKHGHEVKLVDAPVHELSHEQVYADVEKFGPEMVVIYSSYNSLDNDLKVAEAVKKRTRAFTIFVGAWSIIEPEETLRKSVLDAICPKEFDNVVLDLANGVPLKDIKGLIYKEGEGIVRNPDREFMTTEELDQEPFVTGVYKQFLDIPRYFQSSLLHPYIDLFTGRGCQWNQCTYCLWPQTIHKGAKKNYRMRSVDQVMAELEFIRKEIPNVKEVFFQDDMLTQDRAEELANALIEKKIKMKWSGYSKARMDFSVLKRLKRSGCRFLHVGYESSSLDILKNSRKGEIPRKMEEFTRDAKRAGLKIHGDFIFGLPGETRETIKETIRWAKGLKISDYQFVVPEPHPTTQYYTWLKENDYIDQDGQVSYPHLSREELEYWRFKAYREMYFRPAYLAKRILESVHKPAELLRWVNAGVKALPTILKKQRQFAYESL